MKKFMIILVFVLCYNFSYATTLYEKITENNISSGTILKHYKKFTTKGHLSINVLEINLKDKYTDFVVLTSTNGIGSTQNLKDMAIKNNCVAAINGDFFAASSRQRSFYWSCNKRWETPYI